ncbi:MAG: hypothetical protein RLZ68_39, partial [Pseudomonadota bacterium]
LSKAQLSQRKRIAIHQIGQRAQCLWRQLTRVRQQIANFRVFR